MTSNLRMLGILMPIIGLTIGILARTFLARFLGPKWRFYDFLPPFLTLGTELLAKSAGIQGTWAFGIIGVCILALAYAAFLALDRHEIFFSHYFRVVWRLYLLISFVWFGFILLWLLMK